MKRPFRFAALAIALSGSAALAQPARNPAANPNRPALEQQFRERVAKLAQQRIGLSDAQMAASGIEHPVEFPGLNQIKAQSTRRRQLRLR
jgi:hypothetical protein